MQENAQNAQKCTQKVRKTHYVLQIQIKNGSAAEFAAEPFFAIRS